MKGSHRIIVESKKIKYDFKVKRNITILTGDSGSGKTVLIDLIRDYRRYGADSGVFVSCDCECRTIDNEDWKRQIKETSNSILFIDEGNRFLFSKEFASIVQKSDNYFVLATREKLPMLPYSINEIYGFRKSGKFHEAKQTYNEIYHIYGELTEEIVKPKCVITEDSNSGYDFFSRLSDLKEIPCISAKGKSNIIATLQKSQNESETKLVIVDGAAFGSEMKDIMEYANIFGDVVVYAPESFEWILLASNIILDKEIEHILQEPENYIESKEYVSWERFFTDLLIDKTKDDLIWAYSKRRLPKVYLSTKIINAVKKTMKRINW